MYPPRLCTPSPPGLPTPPGLHTPLPLDYIPPRLCTPPRLRTPPDYVSPGTTYPPGTMYPPGLHTPWTTYPPDYIPPRTTYPPDYIPPRTTYPPQAADSSIRSTSGRYASYWNAFLLLIYFAFIITAWTLGALIYEVEQYSMTLPGTPCSSSSQCLSYSSSLLTIVCCHGRCTETEINDVTNINTCIVFP